MNGQICVFSDPFTGVHPLHAVPATTYNGLVNGYSGVPAINFHGVPTALDGVPVTTYNGAPDASYSGAVLSTYHRVHRLHAAHSPGLDSGRVYGYSFGPLPYAYSVFGDLPFAGFHHNVDISDGDLTI